MKSCCSNKQYNIAEQMMESVSNKMTNLQRKHIFSVSFVCLKNHPYVRPLAKQRTNLDFVFRITEICV